MLVFHNAPAKKEAIPTYFLAELAYRVFLLVFMTNWSRVDVSLKTAETKLGTHNINLIKFYLVFPICIANSVYPKE
ncbi:hypothetical protein CTT31_12915 [Pseudoalteromonas maricaloris]|nr:hypothetical protein CTT31_12915 [Pseudoalteromonas flavipulchra]